VEGGNEAETLAEMINLVKKFGVDMIDVSTGGVVLCEMDVYPGYQVRHAEMIKKHTGLPVIAGGLLTSPLMVEEILKNDRAELVFLGRELLRDSNWVYRAAKELHVVADWPVQYERAYK
jgi:NADPH2 dehydrogenase